MAGYTYLVDADALIQAAREHYAFDLVPAFWDRLVRLAESGAIRSIDRVKQELLRGKDDLAKWAKTRFADAFVSTDEADVIEQYANVMKWVQGQDRFLDAAKAEFADGADGWLVAYAAAKGFVVVTHEQPAPESRKDVKIPDVCQAFGVRYVNTFTMLRELGVELA